MRKNALQRILAEEGLKRAGFRSEDVVLYKGKKYKLVWVGPTKFGRRAKLQFLNGQKEFWVDEDAISPSGSTGYGGSSSGRGGRCRGCGGLIRDAPHHRAMGGYCGSCAFDEFDI